MSDLERKRKPPVHSHPTKPTRSGGRTRSNSRSLGSRSQADYDQFAKSSTQTGISPPAITSRNKYTHIIILKSLNGTFETKYLVVPFKPEILKLGRPVVNNSNSNNSGHNGNSLSNSVGSTSSNPNISSKSDSSAFVRPDNGNFDSRVLSRNHACLSCDPKTGKIYIKDLKSSNGTFVNGNRVEHNEVELKIGDVVDLGTDIDSKFEHRKISAFVEEISVIPLINGMVDLNSVTNSTSENIDTYPSNDTGKIVSFSNAYGNTSNTIAATSAQRAAFEAAMFGDVNNVNLEDSVLGPETEILCGIFINNSIGTSPNLINIIKTLSMEVALEKQEYSKLKSMENFLINYTTNLEYVNKLMIEMNDKQLVKLQTTLKQSLSEKHDNLLKDTKEQIRKINESKDKAEKEFRCKELEREERINNLEMEIESLKTRLDVEKYKNSQLNKNQQSCNGESAQKKIVEDSECKNESLNHKSDTSKEKKEKKRNSNNVIFTVVAFSIGVLALILGLTAKQIKK